jgi:hypothetical protein
VRLALLDSRLDSNLIAENGKSGAIEGVQRVARLNHESTIRPGNPVSLCRRNNFFQAFQRPAPTTRTEFSILSQCISYSADIRTHIADVRAFDTARHH